MASLSTVKLSKPPGTSWGFRLQGGKDFATPLCIQKVNVGSVAAQAGLQAGDTIVSIAGVDALTLRHKEAQDTIVRAGNSFDVVIQRGSQIWKPNITTLPEVKTLSDGVPVATKTSLAATQKPFKPIGTRHNVSAAPFKEGLVLPAYNTPINIYSDDSIAETLSAQAEVLGKTGVMGVNFMKNDKNFDGQSSDVLRMVHEMDHEPPVENPATPPAQGYPSGVSGVSAPVTNAASPGEQLRPGENTCFVCERLVVGVFVRVKGKNLHAECFKCSTCGSSLKNVGYYNINDKLYCDAHAKQAARVNPPAPNLEPVVVPPGANAPFGAVTAQQASRMKVPAAFQQNAAPPSHAPVPAPFKAPPPGGVRILPAPTTNLPTPFKRAPVSAPAPPKSFAPAPAPAPALAPVAAAPRPAPNFGSSANPQGFGAPAHDANVRSHIPKKGQSFEWPPRRVVKEVETDEPQPHPPAWAPAGDKPSVPKPVKTPGPLPKRPPLLPTPPPPKDYDTIVMGSTSPAQLVPVKPASAPDAFSPVQKPAQPSPKPVQPTSKPAQAAQTATKPVPPASQLSPKSVQPVQQAPKPASQASPKSPQSPKPVSLCPKPCAPILSSQPVTVIPVTNPSQPAADQPVPKPAQPMPKPAQPTPKPAQPTPKPIQPAPKPVQPAPKPVQPAPKPVQPASTPVQPSPKPAQPIFKPNFAPAANPTPQTIAAPQKSRFRNPAPTLISLSSTSSSSSKSISSSVSKRQTGGISLSPPRLVPINEPMPSVKLDTVPVKFSDPLPPAPIPASKPISQTKSQLTPNPVAGFKSVSAPVQQKPVAKPQRPTGQVPNPASAPAPTLSNLPASAPALSENVAPKPVPSNTPAPAGDVPAPMSFASAPAPAPAPFAPVSAPVYAPAPAPIKPTPPGLGGPGPVRGVLQAPGHRTAPRRGRGIMNQASGSRIPVCSMCTRQIRGPFVSALGKTWCPDHFICATTTCKRNIIDMGFVEEKGGLYCENCYESYMAPICGKCDKRIKGDCLNAVGKQFHPECFCCAYCGRVFGSGAFYLEDGLPYCETDWNDLFTTKCVGCNFPIEAGDRWVEALNNNYHSQCFKCSKCHLNLEGQSFFAKGGKPFCKSHAQRGIL